MGASMRQMIVFIGQVLPHIRNGVTAAVSARVAQGQCGPTSRAVDGASHIEDEIGAVANGNLAARGNDVAIHGQLVAIHGQQWPY